MTLRTLNYGNDGIFLIMGNAGFCPSTVGAQAPDFRGVDEASCGLYPKAPCAHLVHLGHKVPSLYRNPLKAQDCLTYMYYIGTWRLRVKIGR